MARLVEHAIPARDTGRTGKKELVGLLDRVRETAQFWRQVLLDLSRLRSGPSLPLRTARPTCDALEEMWPMPCGHL